MTDGTAEPATARARVRWWRAERWVIVAVALLIAVAAFQADGDADDLEHETATLEATAARIDAREARALRQASGPVLGAYDVDAIVSDLLAGGVESSRAARDMTDALNAAVGRANAGDIDGLHRVADQDGGAALDRLRRSLTPQEQLLARIERVLRRARQDGEPGA
jgi:hypothetical protein